MKINYKKLAIVITLIATVKFLFSIASKVSTPLGFKND